MSHRQVVWRTYEQAGVASAVLACGPFAGGGVLSWVGFHWLHSTQAVVDLGFCLARSPAETEANWRASTLLFLGPGPELWGQTIYRQRGPAYIRVGPVMFPMAVRMHSGSNWVLLAFSRVNTATVQILFGAGVEPFAEPVALRSGGVLEDLRLEAQRGMQGA